jgi:hypothetical protein
VTDRQSRDARWEYKVTWRYGALLLIVVGLLAMGFGASGLCSTPTSATLIPLGFVCLVAGVVLPRIEGNLTVGPSQVSADIVGITTLEQLSVSTSAPAVVLREVQTQEGVLAIETAQLPGAVTLGDVWDALDAAGIKVGSVAGASDNQAVFQGVGLGSAYFRLADGRTLRMPNRGFLDHGTVTSDLLSVLDAWGIHPSASGKYPAPDGALGQSHVMFLQPRD